MLSTRLVLGLALIALLGYAYGATKCPQLDPVSIKLGGVIVTFTGGDMAITFSSSSQARRVAGITWKLDRFVERLRTPYTELGISSYQCIAPRQDVLTWLDLDALTHYLDPLEVPNSEKACTGRDWNKAASTNPACGEIVSQMLVSDLNCEQTFTTDNISGVSVQTVRIDMTHDDYPDMLLVTTYQIADEALNASFTTITNHTQFVSYLADRVKITYELVDYPFMNNDPVDNLPNGFSNESFVTMWWNLTSGVANSQDVSVRAAQNTTFFLFDYNATVDGGPLQLQSYIDATFYMDGDLRVNNGTAFDSGNLFVGAFNPLIVNIPFDICSNHKSHFQTLFYDPSFGAFFSPLSSPSKKGSNSLTIGLAVGLSIGIIAVIVIVIVVLSITYQPVREFFRPYTRRENARKHGKGARADGDSVGLSAVGGADGHSAPPSGWMKPQKPEM